MASRQVSVYSISESHPAARTSEIVVQEIDDELLVYDLKNDKAHHLNKTSALIWRWCDGKTSI